MNFKLQTIQLKIFIFLVCLLGHVSLNARNYYISNAGNDLNKGDSQQSSWKSINRLNQQKLEPSDSVLFKRGDIFIGEIQIKHSGKINQPIVYSAYNIGVNPIISGAITLHDFELEKNSLIKLLRD